MKGFKLFLLHDRKLNHWPRHCQPGCRAIGQEATLEALPCLPTNGNGIHGKPSPLPTFCDKNVRSQGKQQSHWNNEQTLLPENRLKLRTMRLTSPLSAYFSTFIINERPLLRCLLFMPHSYRNLRTIIYTTSSIIDYDHTYASFNPTNPT